ncbi:O-antigen/teichoic acid export membrane protein [Hoeflea halophila]|uniref:O-antigen/teichoic acid export membrane protein n=1 Tax=Hoeflea halophila TaxID=714899 RepID=A0A286ICN5_9HYPH|nr:oligosaccharide flippase family protein [Hoeflea halophila]SOE17822.1 O-antigen/teichoic acid export membrane protein [Hoeflea halophila]
MLNARILRSVFLFTATNALAAAMPLLLMPVLTRVLTPEDYGIVAMFSIVITAFGSLTGLSVHGAVGMRYFDRDEYDFPRYVGNSFIILAVTSVTLLALVTVFREPLEHLTKLPHDWLMVAVGVSAVQFVLLIRLAIFQSAKHAGYFAVFRVGQALVDASISVALVLAFALAWEGRLIGISAGILLLGFAAAVSLFADGYFKLVPSRAYILNALKFGLPLIPHVLGGMLLATVDRVLIANLLGVAETGIYMVAVQIGLGIYLLADACNRAISPWQLEALKRNDKAVDVRIVRYGLLYFLGLVAIALAAGAAAPWVLPVLVGPAFAEAASLIWLIALGQAFGGMYFFVSNIIFYRNKTLSLSAVTISCGLFNAGLSFVLIQVVGLKGAAQAYLVAQIFLFVSAFILSQRLRPLPWRAAFLVHTREL